jgi:two-component system phosphate regulon sensor histidine kinase PhoR
MVFIPTDHSESARQMLQRQAFPGTTVRRRLALLLKPDVVLDVISTRLHVDGVWQGYLHTLEEAVEPEPFAVANEEFLSSVAHELRGPLASQRAYMEMLLADYGTLNQSDIAAMIHILHGIVVRFQELVDNLLDMGQLRAGRFTIVPDATTLNVIIQDALKQMDPLLRTRGQLVVLEIETGENCEIWADRQRIFQVLLNLLQNAFKYAPKEQPITLRSYTQGNFAFVEVTDLGPGIPPEEQAHIFERFYRAKRVEQEGAGIGLGLALAKGIIEAHGGQIGLNSQPGAGTTFWFSVPLVTDGRT